jgi:hypothetical protein
MYVVWSFGKSRAEPILPALGGARREVMCVFQPPVALSVARPVSSRHARFKTFDAAKIKRRIRFDLLYIVQLNCLV